MLHQGSGGRLPGAPERLKTPELVRPSHQRLLIALGLVGVASALIVAIGGWIVLDGITDGAHETIQSAAGVVEEVSTATEAASVAVSTMTAVVEDIEGAARSTGRTLSTVEELLREVSDEAAEEIAASIESTVDAMPGIIQTGRVIDNTLNALSFVGVDYDPEVPLDEALESLRDSLAPLPDEIRSQAILLDEAATDLTEIAEDAGSLSASLLDVRIELLDAERVLRAAAEDVDGVGQALNGLEEEVGSYAGWAPWLAVVLGFAVGSGSAGLLLIGLGQPAATAKD